MKKAINLILALAVLVSLAACGDTEYVDLETRMKQEREERELAKEQAEEISLLLNDALDKELSGLAEFFGMSVKVYNTSGAIYVSMEILDTQLGCAGFGSIADVIGSRFLELIDEYSEYSFDRMMLFYYTTGRNGRKNPDPYMSYDLHTDGAGSLIISTGYKEHALYSLSPGELEEFLSEFPHPKWMGE